MINNLSISKWNSILTNSYTWWCIGFKPIIHGLSFGTYSNPLYVVSQQLTAKDTLTIPSCAYTNTSSLSHLIFFSLSHWFVLDYRIYVIGYQIAFIIIWCNVLKESVSNHTVIDISTVSALLHISFNMFLTAYQPSVACPKTL